MYVLFTCITCVYHTLSVCACYGTCTYQVTAVLCSRAKQARCAEQYRSKNQYQRGMWNVNTVLMGGLGEDPDSSGSASEEGAAIFSMYTHNMYMHI